MASLAPLDRESRVLDLGSGYGGPAIFLAPTFGCHVTGLNVSAVEIEEAEKRIESQGLTDRVSFDCGDFHELPYAAESFDVVWSQDSLMYGADKRRILQEVHRVLKPGGRIHFLEHGHSPDAKVAKWQRRLNWLQRIIGDGCTLTLDVPELLSTQPFDSVEIDKF